jgi:hypothetical protein
VSRRASLNVLASRTLAWGGEARGPRARPAEPVWTEIGLIVRDDNLPRRGHGIEPLSVLCREPDVHCPQTVLALRGPTIGLVTPGCCATLASAPWPGVAPHSCGRASITSGTLTAASVKCGALPSAC